MSNILVVGNPSLDQIDNVYYGAGGPVSYISNILSSYSHNVTMFSSFADDFPIESLNPKINLIKNISKILLILIFFTTNASGKDNENLYKKIDLFGEVLDKVKKEYVDEINESDIMDAAINGVLQHLDPYSVYMNPELFENMQTDTKGEFGGLGIEVSMEAGVVKVISPIDDTPASEAGIKAGDYIIKINDEQVQGKTLMEAVKLMRDVLKLH